jgi:chaperonin GroES
VSDTTTQAETKLKPLASKITSFSKETAFDMASISVEKNYAERPLFLSHRTDTCLRRARRDETIWHKVNASCRSPNASPFSTPTCLPEKIRRMNVVPLGENVIVKRTEAERKTAGGIVLPESAQKRPDQGRVLSVGDGRLLKDGARAASQVREGDRVLFSPWSGTEVEVDGDKLLIMPEQDILAVLD